MKSVNGWTREKVIALINTNNAAVERAMVVVFNNQTRDEQRIEATTHNNGIGFAACDARKGSYYAKWVLSGKHLTGRHLERARKMACKYVGQLMAAIAEKA